jgi:hypothetical protein
LVVQHAFAEMVHLRGELVDGLHLRIFVVNPQGNLSFCPVPA